MPAAQRELLAEGEPAVECRSLEVRYGQIGISAVVAAMRYQGYAKKPAHVSADRQPDRWLKDMVPEIAA